MLEELLQWLPKKNLVRAIENGYILEKDLFSKGDKVVNKEGVKSTVIKSSHIKVMVKDESGYWYESHSDLTKANY